MPGVLLAWTLYSARARADYPVPSGPRFSMSRKGAVLLTQVLTVGPFAMPWPRFGFRPADSGLGPTPPPRPSHSSATAPHASRNRRPA